MKILEVTKKARETIKRCFKDVPSVTGVKIKAPGRELAEADYVVQVTCRKGRSQLIIEVQANGEPRFARSAVNALLRYRETRPQAYPVFIAPYISPRSAEICRAEGVGYLDLVGNCRLSFDDIHISREGIPNPHASPKKLKMIYAPKASRILRVLLASAIRPWKMQELATEAGVSLGQVSKVKNSLLDRELVENAPGGIRLIDPRAMLAGWTDNYEISKSKSFGFYCIKEISQVEHDLAASCDSKGIRYGFTGFSGAARLAPAVRYKKITAYIQDDIESVAAVSELKPVTSGANVSLLLPYDDGVFYGSADVHGTNVVSAVQVYLDLLEMHGRSEEAAEFLLRQVLEKKW